MSDTKTSFYAKQQQRFELALESMEKVLWTLENEELSWPGLIPNKDNYYLVINQLRQIVAQCPTRFKSKAEMSEFWLGVKDGKDRARSPESQLLQPIIPKRLSAASLGCIVGWRYARLKQKVEVYWSLKNAYDSADDEMVTFG